MDEETFAASIRDAFVEAAVRAWDEAGMAGLCAEGRWEAALGALRSVSILPFVNAHLRSRPDGAEPGR